MIARGDLGVQIPIEDVPAVQKKLINKANLLGRPVITATQMLLSMTENIRPTRAEVSDVANAIFDGTDAVMLSEETAIGKYPVETVEMIAKIATSAERERKSVQALADLPAYFRTGEGSDNFRVEHVFSMNTAECANALHVRFILAHAKNKGMACFISRFKPDCWILSFGVEGRTNDFSVLSYGVYPVRLEDKTNAFSDTAMQFLIKAGMVEKDEKMILIEDESNDAMPETLLMKIFKV
jgi:pyruvate kinase